MKKLVLFLAMVLLISCSTEEEVLTPVFEISLDGESFDPYERYAKIETFGGEKWVDNKLKKIFILYLQIDDGEPRLDKQHFSLYCLDSDVNLLNQTNHTQIKILQYSDFADLILEFNHCITLK